jgi:hypothetical protein
MKLVNPTKHDRKSGRVGYLPFCDANRLANAKRLLSVAPLSPSSSLGCAFGRRS